MLVSKKPCIPNETTGRPKATPGIMIRIGHVDLMLFFLIFICIFIFLNFDNSIDITHRVLRFPEVILVIVIEGTLSQIIYSCLSSHFMVI